MMYAQRFADGPRFRPASMGAALAINGAVIAALLLAAPEVTDIVAPPRIPIFDVKQDPLPPPPNPDPATKAEHPTPRPIPTSNPDPAVDNPTKSETIFDTGTVDPGPSEGSVGTGTVIEPAKPVVLALVAAAFDPRYADDVEPAYPDYLRDAGVEGVVKLRIVIGANGRVKQADALGGDAALTKLAIRHVLAKWRFRPATRGGIPEESTRVMNLRFRLEN